MSASISPVEALPFLDDSVEQDGQVQASPHAESNRLPRRTWTALRILGGVVALTMVVLAVFHPMGRLMAAQETDATIAAVAVKKGGKAHKKSKAPKKEQGDPFTQCGGNNYKGETCCKSGCACITDSKYYSQCKPPTDLQKCNVAASKGEVKHAKKRESAAKTELTHANTDRVKAKKDAEDRVKAFKDAKKEAKQATHIWEAKDAQEKKQIEAAKQDQSEVFSSAASERKAAVKRAKEERAKVETAAKERLAKITNNSKASQDRIVTKAKETRDKLVEKATAAKKKHVDEAHAEVKSVDEEAKKKATAKKEAATKERIQTIKDAEAARDNTIKETKAAWTKSDDEAIAAKAKTAKALKEAKALAAAASAALKKQAVELGNVTDWVTYYKKQEEMRSTKKCSTMWKDCKNSNCCSLGCKCQWQSKYYASCTGLFGSDSFCEKDKAIAKQEESLRVLPGLEAEHKKLKADDEKKNKGP